MKLSEKRIAIGNIINVELDAMCERALNLLGNIDSTNIDTFESHFMNNEKIRENNFGKRIIREHIVQYILEEFGVKAFGLNSVGKNESKNSQSRARGWENKINS